MQVVWLPGLHAKDWGGGGDGVEGLSVSLRFGNLVVQSQQMK